MQQDEVIISPGVAQIGAERNKQIAKGYLTTHDLDRHYNSSLTGAAIGLLQQDYDAFGDLWTPDQINKYMNLPLKERLIMAGAFIAAEIEVIDNLALVQPINDKADELGISLDDLDELWLENFIGALQIASFATDEVRDTFLTKGLQTAPRKATTA